VQSRLPVGVKSIRLLGPGSLEYHLFDKPLVESL